MVKWLETAETFAQVDFEKEIRLCSHSVAMWHEVIQTFAEAYYEREIHDYKEVLYMLPTGII